MLGYAGQKPGHEGEIQAKIESNAVSVDEIDGESGWTS